MKISIYELYKIYLEQRKIVTDTRKIIPGAIFFALKGPNFDANSFAASALENGCSYAVVDDPAVIKDDRYLLTDDVLDTLQKLAGYHRSQLKIPVFGLTGSNGKTTTKELLRSVLSKKFNTIATEGNLNNHIGVPLTLLSILPEHEFAIIEMGANHIGEIAQLSSFSDPDAGLITNIGKAHLEGFGGEEGVRKGKGELYDHLRKQNAPVFVFADDNLLMRMSEGMNRQTYGTKNDSDVKGEITSADPFLSVKIKLGTEEYSVQTKLVGDYNFPNILAAAAVGLFYKVAPEKIAEGIRSYTPDNMRSQVIRKEKSTIILDAYNANPSSMKVAIENFARMNISPKYFILGDMLELGDASESEHRSVVDQTKKYELNGFFVGKYFSQCGDMNIQSFINVDELNNYLKGNPISGTILVKGSRGIKLEKVIEVL